MDTIKAYLKNQTLLEDKKRANKIKKRLFIYYLENDRLYKRSFSMLLMMSLNEEKANYVIKKVI